MTNENSQKTSDFQQKSDKKSGSYSYFSEEAEEAQSRQGSGDNHSDVNKKIDFQGQTKELEVNQQKIADLQEELEAANRKITDQEKKLEAASRTTIDQTKELEAANRERLIFQKLNEDREEFEKDQQDLEDLTRKISILAQRRMNLIEAFKSENKTFENCFDTAESIYLNFPAELYQTRLQNYQEGLRLTRRMLERLPEQFPDSGGIEDFENLEKPLRNQDILSLLDSCQEAEIQEIEALDGLLSKRLKEVGQKRWQIIQNASTLAKKHQTQFLKFVEKRILPILDGIDSREKNAEASVEELKSQISSDTECKTQEPSGPLSFVRQKVVGADKENISALKQICSELDSWLSTYKQLRPVMLTLLRDFEIYPMDVTPNTPMDYEKFDPLAVEPDDTLDDEVVKEINRKGYEYRSEAGVGEVLRAAQVTVVKNNSSEETNHDQ